MEDGGSVAVGLLSGVGLFPTSEWIGSIAELMVVENIGKLGSVLSGLPS